jgi:hypothetical protein
VSDKLQLQLTRFRNGALLVGIAGLVACGVGAASNTKQFFVSYLFGYLFWLGLALGCFTIAMIHHLTGGRWGYPIRRLLEAGFSTLPLMVLLFIPILFGLQELYPWARGDEIAGEDVLRKRLPYMNAPWFIARTTICLLLWTVMAWLLRRWSLTQDATTDLQPSRRLRKLSGVGVLLFPLTATFVYIDWIMSLEKEWYSTVFAVIILAGDVLCAFAFATMLLKLFEKEEPIAGALTTLIYHQLGNLLLTFVLFWTYVSFGQLLIVYSANLPQEIKWYLHRIAGTWKIVVAIIAGLHFFVPFFLLLFRVMKKNPRYLVTIAAMLFLVHIIAVYWLVVPSFHQNGVEVNWLDVAAPIGIGGVWVAAFLWLLARAPLMPRNDPRMKQELVYGAH